MKDASFEMGRVVYSFK